MHADLRCTFPATRVLLTGLLVCGCGEYGQYVDNVTRHEMAGILRQGGFPASQGCKVEHSYYNVAPPPNNDYFKAYAIHLAPFPDSLLATNQTGSAAWQTGADTNEAHLRILRRAKVEATSTTNVWWLPHPEDFVGTNYYRRFVYVQWQGNDPNPAAFFAYNRGTHTLYFVAYKH